MESNETMRRARPGSMGYQLLQVLKTAFQPGTSRQAVKARGDAALRIFSKETMKTYTAEAFALAAYLKEHYPDCRRPTTSRRRCALLSWKA